jgi:hypothetical protein
MAVRVFFKIGKITIIGDSTELEGLWAISFSFTSLPAYVKEIQLFSHQLLGSSV